MEGECECYGDSGAHGSKKVELKWYLLFKKSMCVFSDWFPKNMLVTWGQGL